MSLNKQDRVQIINKIGVEYHTANIEEGEYSYIDAVGGRIKLEKLVGHKVEHFKLDIRLYNPKSNIAILIETKPNFIEEDEAQLSAYVENERAINPQCKIIAILANTKDNKIKVWKNYVSKETILKDEEVIQDMEHYESLFAIKPKNNREEVMKNTYALNETLHKKDIDESLRSQFVGTCLLYIKDLVDDLGNGVIDKKFEDKFVENISSKKVSAIIAEIEEVLDGLLDGSANKDIKIKLLKNNVLEDQKVKRLTQKDWVDILKTILTDIYRYINLDSSEGQDILNLFFITFNKYTGKADKNQAFTPDHITDFMTRLVDVNRNKRVLDICCGSGSFLVQAMVKELADCRKGTTDKDAKELMKSVKENNIWGIEIEEKAYGLATTNMLIHGDGNSNIIFGSCFDKKKEIIEARPNVILMNPPYNAKPKGIPSTYQMNWGKDLKEDPTKGLVFVKYLSDIIEEQGWTNIKLAVLLPLATAIGTSKQISTLKEEILKNNTLEAVFTLPSEIFYPGASTNVCCMLFTMGEPHYDTEGKPKKKTFFGYYKEDGFKKKKNLGRVEQENKEGQSIWKTEIESKWLDAYKNKDVIDGFSAQAYVTGADEWLCEAYMKTDYSTLTDEDFQKTLNNYLAYLVKEGNIYEAKN